MIALSKHCFCAEQIYKQRVLIDSMLSNKPIAAERSKTYEYNSTFLAARIAWKICFLKMIFVQEHIVQSLYTS